LDIPDAAYNSIWLVDKGMAEPPSTVLDISASIIQRSAIGPDSYVVNFADLTTVTPGNAMFKYAYSV